MRGSACRDTLHLGLSHYSTPQSEHLCHASKLCTSDHTPWQFQTVILIVWCHRSGVLSQGVHPIAVATTQEAQYGTKPVCCSYICRSALR